MIKHARGVATFVAGGVVALILTGGTAYAATGGKFILGQSNSAGKTSSLSNPNGTPLSLNARAGSAPLKVNRSTRVANLNADKLDGVNSTSFALASGRTGQITAASTWVPAGDGGDIDGDGWSDVLVAFAQCPGATKIVGGGSNNSATFDFSFGRGITWYDAPAENGWGAITFADEEIDFEDALQATAVCYNPRGQVSGADFQSIRATSVRQLPSSLRSDVKSIIAKHR